jgi:hypothetical protein
MLPKRMGIEKNSSAGAIDPSVNECLGGTNSPNCRTPARQYN